MSTLSVFELSRRDLSNSQAAALDAATRRNDGSDFDLVAQIAFEKLSELATRRPLNARELLGLVAARDAITTIANRDRRRSQAVKKHELEKPRIAFIESLADKYVRGKDPCISTGKHCAAGFSRFLKKAGNYYPAELTSHGVRVPVELGRTQSNKYFREARLRLSKK